MTTGEPAADPSLRDAGAVAAALGVDPAAGLSSAEAARRLAADGPNELAAAPAVPVWRRIIEQLRSPLVYLLLGAAVVAVAAWLAEGAAGWPWDAVVILVIVLANAVLGYVQEARAERAVAALQELTAATAGVLRDGIPTRVPARVVVRGDVLVLAEGDTVAADARLLAANALTVAEAALTGESVPVLKDAARLDGPQPLADRLDMVFAGTAVSRGVGRAVVTATGMGTQMGGIASLLEATPQEATPLQREIGVVGRALGLAVVVIAAVVVGTVLVAAEVRTASDAVAVLLLGVSLAVAAVPEGLPAILTVVLALGVQRMARERAIVKDLSSVETLGSASVICSDKTGTLTRNEMTIERVATASGEAVITGVGYRPGGRVEVKGVPIDDPRVAGSPVAEEVRAVLAGGSLANQARLAEDADGGWVVHGDPTEGAFLVAERKLAGATDARVERFERVGLVPFTSERKLMSSLVVDTLHEGAVIVVTKGAPDVLLARCTKVRVGHAVLPLDDARRERALADVERLSGRALRTLGVAYRPLGEPAAGVRTADESVEHDLVYVGMVGILDPPRPEAAAAVAEAHRAGIRVLMITGDHPRTAGRVAADLGIAAPGAPVLTGAHLAALPPHGLAEAVREVSVYARVAPEDKLRIVDALQADGAVVAMTGDGVNDAPALKAADIGVAMGVTGTEVTKEAAAMILADDNFATIVAAVREGRAIFDDIRKFLRYLLSSNMGEVLTVFLGVVLAGVIGLTSATGAAVAPLLATQILWINLLTDTGPALAIGVDPQTEDVMGRPPRGPGARIIDRRMWTSVLLVGLVMALVTLATMDLYLPGGLLPPPGDAPGTLENARTAGFTVLVLAQLFNCFNARSERASAARHLWANGWLWAAVGLSAALQVLVVHLPVLNRAFRTVPLSPSQWGVCVAMASLVLWASELAKVVRRARAAVTTGPSPT
jgi:magnesium-transporting ATPase (P-type)